MRRWDSYRCRRIRLPAPPIMRLARAGSEAFASADAIGTTPSLARGSFMAFPCSFFRIREATRNRPIAWIRPSRYGNPTSGSGTRFQIGNLFWRTYVQSLGRSSKISLGRRHRTKNEVLARPMCVHFCLLPRTAIANSTHCLSSSPSWRIVALGAQPTNLCANMLRRGKSCT